MGACVCKWRRGIRWAIIQNGRAHVFVRKPHPACPASWKGYIVLAPGCLTGGRRAGCDFGGCQRVERGGGTAESDASSAAETGGRRREYYRHPSVGAAVAEWWGGGRWKGGRSRGWPKCVVVRGGGDGFFARVGAGKQVEGFLYILSSSVNIVTHTKARAHIYTVYMCAYGEEPYGGVYTRSVTDACTHGRLCGCWYLLRVKCTVRSCLRTLERCLCW